MPPVRTVSVPRLGPQLGFSQRDEPEPDQTTNRTEPRPKDERGNRRGRGEKPRSLLKVKLPKLNNRTSSKRDTEEDTTPRKWMSEPANETKTTAKPGGETQRAGSESHSAGVDVFCFSQRPASEAINEKAKAKLAVLRTISKMLEENQLIRQRLATACQAN